MGPRLFGGLTLSGTLLLLDTGAKQGCLLSSLGIVHGSSDDQSSVEFRLDTEPGKTRVSGNRLSQIQ